MTSTSTEETSADIPQTSRTDNPCDYCLKTKFKYKCPRCGIKTCSLECCRAHKESTGCTGQRDKTKYISKDEFNENVLINDYRFLEEQTRVIDAYQRASELGEEHILNGKTLSSLNQDPTKNIQFYGTYENLRKFVYKQSKICLKLMPPQSTRHINNKTRFNRVKNMVSWSLEFIFHLRSQELSKGNKYFRFDTKKVLFSSKETLRSCLKYFYEKLKDELFDKSALKYEKNEDRVKKLTLLNEQFKNLYEEQNFDDLNILFEVQDLKECKRFFINFDLDKKLEDCIKNQTLIEYPSLYLVRKEDLGEYEVIENCSEIVKQNEMILVEEEKKEDEEKPEDEEEGELEDSEESEVDEEETLSKKIRLDSSSVSLQIDQNDDQDMQSFSDELEEGEERD